MNEENPCFATRRTLLIKKFDELTLLNKLLSKLDSQTLMLFIFLQDDETPSTSDAHGSERTSYQENNQNNMNTILRRTSKCLRRFFMITR